MVTELVQLTVVSGQESAFEAHFAKTQPLFSRAKGCHGATLYKSIEHASQYWILVEWETLENHTHDFANSDDFKKFVDLVGADFASPPTVVHGSVVGA